MKHLIKSNPAYSDGWRKIEDWRVRIESKMLILSRATADKSKNRQTRLKKAAEDYLDTVGQLSDKLYKVRVSCALSMVDLVLFEQLEYFRKMFDR